MIDKIMLDMLDFHLCFTRSIGDGVHGELGEAGALHGDGAHPVLGSVVPYLRNTHKARLWLGKFAFWTLSSVY